MDSLSHHDASLHPKNRFGVSYLFTKKGHELSITIHSPSSEEICQIQEGEAEFALVYQKDILFFLSRFSSPVWLHAPFQWYLVPRIERALPQIWGDWEKEACLQIFLIDKDSQQILTKRILSLSSTFTSSLYGAIILQASRLWIGEQAFQEQLKDIYQSFPSSEDLLKIATARTYISFTNDNSL